MLKDNPLVQLKHLIDNEIWEMRKNYVGIILTIIDASISDKEQRNGIKSLIEKEMYSLDNFKWFSLKIGRIILEFNSKFGKELSLTPDDLEYLKTGEYPKPQGEQSPPGQNSYFN